MGKQTEAGRIRLASRYVRAVRGTGLATGESPIKLAVKLLQETHRMIAIGVAEKNIDYIDRHKTVMLEVISANKHKLPKRTKRSKPEFLESFEWRKLRMQALVKYGPRCMCCGASPQTGATMHVDHIKPRLTHPELALALDNLQILCHECNHGKGNWDTTDWRGKTDGR
jgi:hypothetical protein